MSETENTPTQLEMLLIALSKAEPENRISTLKTFLLEEGRDLEGLRSEAAGQAAQLSANDDLTDADFSQLDVLADIATAIANRFSQVKRLNDINGRFSTATAVSAPDAPGSAPAPVETKSDDDGGDKILAGTVVTAAGGSSISTTSSAQVVPHAPIRTSLQAIPSRGIASMVEGRGAVQYELVAAADVSGVPAGTTIEGIDHLAQLAITRMKDLNRLGPGMRAGSGLATFQKHVPDEKMIGVDGEGHHQIEYVANEKNLRGGSLVAAGGWCAPSEQLTGWCDEESMDGLLDIPTITTRSGGVKWFKDVPFFPDVWTAANGWCFTETQMMLPPPPPEDASHRPLKTCTTVPCPTLQECRLDACGICVQIDLLQDRAFPTYVQRFLRRLLGAHQRRMSVKILNAILAFDTIEEVTVTQGADPTPPALRNNPYGPGATAAILNLLELQILHYRARRRLGLNQTLEVVAPFWLKGLIRADLAKRNGVDLLRVSDQDIAQYFAIRGARVQYIYDWQDTVIGGTTAPTVWPSTVQLLIFAAGSFVAVKQDVITLDAVYDSVTLSKNTYNYFTEEGICVLDRCTSGTLLTLPVCPDGSTGGQVVPTYTVPCASA